MSTGELAIRYAHILGDVEPRHLEGFFVGWPAPPDAAKHLDVLRGSSEVVLAWDDASHRVVGFINALTDGHLSAFIPLLEVLPAYQGRGIGRELVRRMIDRLESYYAVDIVCDAEVCAFYLRLGFIQGESMMLRRRELLGQIHARIP